MRPGPLGLLNYIIEKKANYNNNLLPYVNFISNLQKVNMV